MGKSLRSVQYFYCTSQSPQPKAVQISADSDPFVKESGDHFLAILSRLVMATPDIIRSALHLQAVMLHT